MVHEVARPTAAELVHGRKAYSASRARESRIDIRAFTGGLKEMA
jgi:hypothetical protein